MTYDWSAALYLCSRASVDPVFTSQAKRKTNLSVFLVLTLMLMWPQFSLAYTCAYAYAYAPVKTRLLTSYRKILVYVFAPLTYAYYPLIKLMK